MQLIKAKKLHFVGIKGVAMCALAILAKQHGIAVSGSDTAEVFLTDVLLEAHGIAVDTGFSPKHVRSELDAVIYTGAHGGQNNVEVQTARAHAVPVYPHARALALFMRGKQGISVAGTHGKTTTAAMLATVLQHAKLNPSYAIGCAGLQPLGAPAHAGSGDYFVAEADEYVTDPGADQTPRFVWQEPDVAVITNIEFDHPDVYRTIAQLQTAFEQFARKAKQFVCLNIDDKHTAQLLPRLRIETVTVGRDTGEYQYGNVRWQRGKTTFSFRASSSASQEITLSVPGEHNVRNATLAAATLHRLGIDGATIRHGLATFTGTKRRFEFVGEAGNILLYDDYAHHPTEIRATLKAARQWFPKQHIVAVFQPHTYSRTSALFDEFAKSFADCDAVFVADIYTSAREKTQSGVSATRLAQAIQRYKKEAYYAPNQQTVVQYLIQSPQKTLVISMGAGDIYHWLSGIMYALQS